MSAESIEDGRQTPTFFLKIKIPISSFHIKIRATREYLGKDEKLHATFMDQEKFVIDWTGKFYETL